MTSLEGGLRRGCTRVPEYLTRIRSKEAGARQGHAEVAARCCAWSAESSHIWSASRFEGLLYLNGSRNSFPNPTANPKPPIL